MPTTRQQSSVPYQHVIDSPTLPMVSVVITTSIDIDYQQVSQTLNSHMISVNTSLQEDLESLLDVLHYLYQAYKHVDNMQEDQCIESVAMTIVML